MMRFIIGVPALLLLIGTSAGFSQNNTFQSLQVGFNTAYSLSNNSFTRSWNPSPSAQLNIQIPFYLGLIEGGLRYTRFNNSAEQPLYSDFHSAFIYLGWGKLFALVQKLNTGPVLRFGNTFFRYDEPKTYTNQNTSFVYSFDTEESEFTYEVLIRTEYQFSKRWTMHSELTMNRIKTFEPVQLTLVTFGFSLSLDSPAWLQKVMK